MGSKWAILFSVGKKVNREVKPNHSNHARPSEDKFTLTNIERGCGLPTAADFVSVLRDFTAFKDTEKRELMVFERKLAFFHAYSKNGGIVPLGRFTSKNLGRVTEMTYYIHVYPICPGSSNDGETDRQSQLRNVTIYKSGTDTEENKLLVFGRLIADDAQTYWIVAMDAKNILYTLRAENISPDEEYEEDGDLDFTPNTGTTASNGSAVSHDQSSLANGSQNGSSNCSGSRKNVYTMRSFDSSTSIDTFGGRGDHHQEFAGSTNDFDRNGYPTRIPHPRLDGDCNRKAGTGMNGIAQYGAQSTAEMETPNRYDAQSFITNEHITKTRYSSTSSKTFSLNSTQVETIFSKKHDKTVNVFDANQSQLVFKLGSLNLLDYALTNLDQELTPEPCSDIKAWSSTALTSS